MKRIKHELELPFLGDVQSLGYPLIEMRLATSGYERREGYETMHILYHKEEKYFN